MRWTLCWLGLLLLTNSGLAFAQPHNLVVNVQQVGHRKFATDASFVLPLRHCQAWQYLTDYDSAAGIPGVLSSKTSRMGETRARTSLLMEEDILFLKIRMRSVLDFIEHRGLGTDFAQIEGDARSFTGTWRLEPQEQGTLFRYHSVFEPDSVLPMAVIQYFFDRRLRNSFSAIAQIGAKQQAITCD